MSANLVSPTKDITTAYGGVFGGVDLVYDTRVNSSNKQHSYLAKQWVRPPLHLAKSYEENQWALNLLMSPTAGLLAGDRIKLNIQVINQAKAAVISPAACRIHTMKSGSASITQHYKISNQSILDIWAAPLILQKQASLNQNTRVDIDASSTLFMLESIMPGRSAYAESFTFDAWSTKLEIYLDEELLVYENFTVEPNRGDTKDWQTFYPDAHYASFYYISPQVKKEFITQLHELELGVDNKLGASLCAGNKGIGIKILSRNSLHLRKAILAVRNFFEEQTSTSFPHASKRAQTFYH